MSDANCEHDPEDRHLRQAARWLVTLQRRNLSSRQLLRWSKWLDSARNREAFDALEPIWHLMQSPLDNTCSASPTPRTVSEEAAYWYFVCVDAPSALRSDRRRFLAWLRCSAENVAELFKIAELDGRLRRLELTLKSLGVSRSNVIELTPRGSPPRLHREVEADFVNKRTLTFKLTAFAASLMFGIALAFVARDYIRSEQVVTTGASQWHHQTLSDGTAVHVDAHSKVEFEYTNESRLVYVHAGSAVFEVAKESKRPFIARTPLIDVIAIGTRFSVSVKAGVTTTVSEGVVKVTGRANIDGVGLILRAGEELTLSDRARASPQIAQVDAERKLQWANGWLMLGGLTVAEGIEELNRRNRMQIVLENPDLGKHVVKFARVKVDSPESYANAVAAEQGVTIVVDKNNDVIRLSE